jgi:hypothetical protein
MKAPLGELVAGNLVSGVVPLFAPWHLRIRARRNERLHYQSWGAMWARCARPLPNEAFSPAIS